MKSTIKKIPILGNALIYIRRKLFPVEPFEFTTSGKYWEDLYKIPGENSGPGSYNHLARFKAEILNDFVVTQKINNVIEYGSGDGNQLKYFNFPNYTGFDVSKTILKECKKLYGQDNSKSFYHIDDSRGKKITGELTLSLDVIYHLVEDDVFEKYMHRLFDTSTKYVIIYSCDFNEGSMFGQHVKARKFTDWVKIKKKEFELIEFIKNKYPFDENRQKETSFADFFIYRRMKN